MDRKEAQHLPDPEYLAEGSVGAYVHDSWSLGQGDTSQKGLARPFCMEFGDAIFFNGGLVLLPGN